MGIGTTMDEKMFSPEDLYALIRRQEEQREGIEIQVQGKTKFLLNQPVAVKASD